MLGVHVHILTCFLFVHVFVAAEDLLTVPPGFTKGIDFNKGKVSSLMDVSSPQTINITDLMTADEWLVPDVTPEKKEEVDGPSNVSFKLTF